MVTLNVEDHFAAVQTAINAQLGDWRCYDYGEVPGSSNNLTPTAGAGQGALPARYVLLTVTRRAEQGGRRYGGSSQIGWWRVVAAAFATDAAGVRWLLDRIRVLEDQPLTVGGQPTTPLQYEPASNPSTDSGAAGAVGFTYNL